MITCRQCAQAQLDPVTYFPNPETLSERWRPWLMQHCPYLKWVCSQCLKQPELAPAGQLTRQIDLMVVQMLYLGLAYLGGSETLEKVCALIHTTWFFLSNVSPRPSIAELDVEIAKALKLYVDIFRIDSELLHISMPPDNSILFAPLDPQEEMAFDPSSGSFSISVTSPQQQAPPIRKRLCQVQSRKGQEAKSKWNQMCHSERRQRRVPKRTQKPNGSTRG